MRGQNCTPGNIPGVTQANVAHVFGAMTLCVKPDNECRRQILINQEAISRIRRSAASAYIHQADDGMISLRGGEGKASVDVLGLKVWIVLKYLSARGACRQHVEHVFDAHPHAANTRPAATLARVKCNARLPAHGSF